MMAKKNNNDDALQASLRVDQICDAFEETILAGDDPSIVDYMADVDDSIRETLFEQLLKIEVELSPDDSQQMFDRYLQEFPLFSPIIRRVQATNRFEESAARETPKESLPIGSMREYELLERIGEGGMGAVYKARHSKLDKIVAIKVLPAEKLKDLEAVARFEREMRAVGKLEHPNIVRAMDAREVDGVHFLVMEYVHGIDLSRLVNQLGPLPIADACELIRQAAVGLDEANDHDMVHRDIKPSNLILAFPRRKRRPVVKILDMGLALLSDAHLPDAEELTQTGQLMGTLDYMAPEQGGNTHNVDIRADIYSLGATLYRLLTGKVIYHGEEFSTPVQKIVGLATLPAPPIHERRSDTPAELSQVVHKMLAKSPELRCQTPEEVADALDPFCEGCDLTALIEKTQHHAPEENRADQSETVATRDALEPTAERKRKAETNVTNPSGFEVTIDTATRPPARADATPPSRAVQPSVARPEIQSRPVGKRFTTPWWLAGTGLALLLLMSLFGAAMVIFVQTPEGTLRVEINDPSIQVKIEGTDIVFTQKENKPIKIAAGGKSLVVTRDDFSFVTRQFILKDGKTTVVKVDLLPGKVQVVAAGDLIGSEALTPEGPRTPTQLVDGRGNNNGHDRDQAAIDLTFELGGVVQFDQDGNYTTLKKGDLLPLVPYQLILAFNGSHATKPTDEDLKTIALAPSLSQLNLKGAQLTDRGIKELQAAKGITILGLADVPVSDEGLDTIASLKSLQTLFLSSGDQPISGEGLAKLSQLTNLQILNFDATTLDDSHLQALGGCPSLQALTLTVRSECTADNLDGLEPLYESITNLQLIGNGLKAKHIKSISQFKNLMLLRLEQCDLTGASFDFVHRLTSLQSVGLFRSRLGADNIAQISMSQSIRMLELPETTVTNDELAALQNAVRLSSLALHNNSQLTDEAVVHLAKLKLNNLSISRTDISLQGVVQLKQALPDAILTSNFSEEEIEAAVAPSSGDDLKRDKAAIAFGFSLGAHVGVTKDGKEQSLKPGDPLPEPPYELTFIFRSGSSQKLNDKDMKILGSAPSLKRLDLQGAPITDRGIEELQGSKRITHLQLRDVPLSDDSLVAIGSLTPLQSLNFSSGPNTISGEGLAKLSHLPKLRDLRLQTKFIDETHLKAIGACKSLESLNLQVSEKCSAETLHALAPIFDSVTRLELHGGFQGRQLSGIEKFRYLSYVNLQQCDLTGLRFEFVQQAGHQQALSLIGSQLDSDAIAEISRSIGIHELNLQQTNVNNADLAMLEKMPKLSRLNLGYNPQLTDDAVPHLVKLKLKYLSVHGTGLTANGVWRLKKVLPDNLNPGDFSEAEIEAAGK